MNKTKLYKTLFAFFLGLLAVSILFLLSVFNIASFEKSFPQTTLNLFLHILILSALLEEGIKFILIKKRKIDFPSGFFLGLGFGVGETLLKYPISDFGPALFSRSGAIVLHILTAGIICYSIKKKKPLIGFLVAIILHAGFNCLIYL